MKSLKFLFVLISVILMTQWAAGQVKNENPESRKIGAEEKYPVPVLEVNQKHGRVLGQAWATDAAAIHFAKSKGVSPYEFGCYIGKLFAPSWGTDRSFDRLIKGSLFNIETFRHITDTAIEVNENTDGSVSIVTSENMWHKYFADNNPFASFSEFMDFSRGLFGEIAAYMESDFAMEITNAKVIFTFRKK